jgi:hypothetical protein
MNPSRGRLSSRPTSVSLAFALLALPALVGSQGSVPQGVSALIDFSFAGYEGGGQAIPDVPIAIVVSPADGDDGQRIQTAIDIVAKRPTDSAGFRGAILLERGQFEVMGSIRLGASGIVLRGSASNDDGTTILAAGHSRRALVDVLGDGQPSDVPNSVRFLIDDSIAAGSRTVSVGDAGSFQVGDRVVVRRPSTKEWIGRLGMDAFEGWRPETRLFWTPGSRDVSWHRTVVAIENGRITLDAPITTTIARTDGGTIARYVFPGRIDHVGVENLRLVSAFETTRPKDEDHSWTGIAFDKVENAWARQLKLEHFAGTAVDVRAHSRAITIEDVDVVDPVAEDGNYRRRGFSLAGELTLVQRCSSRSGRNDFITGFAAAGPNVFLDCSSSASTGPSGSLDSWASGVLLDNVSVRGDALRLTNRGTEDQGAGWTGAHSVLWNCEATDVEVRNPPGAANYAYGCKGILSGDGIVNDPRVVPARDFFRGLPVEPRSLYMSQLAARRGAGAVAAIGRRAISTTSERTAKVLDDRDVRGAAAAPATAATTTHGLSISDGRFTIDGVRAWVKRVGYSWFQAQMTPSMASSFGPAITRFAPGHTGPGLTDDLEQVVAAMPRGGVFYQHYGLWYDRRRVNHNYDGSAERRTGDVWAPFMELPWARSGIGKSWDGLSRYDLTRFNPWYFDRVKAFADLCDREGRILYYNFYFQHWLLESRAHYVDFPWRPVNALQDTGLPDEVPAANAFWDIAHPVRRDLHRRYIRQVLDTLGENRNVVFGLDPEYTGSLAFVRFWLDEIAAWQRERNRGAVIALEVPKDQMEAILNDPIRGSLVAAIDFHGWVYRPDGKLFAARGDLNRSLREQRADIATPQEQQALLHRLDPAMAANPDFQNSPEFQKLFDQLWASTPALKKRAIDEYRARFPRLVILAEPL